MTKLQSNGTSIIYLDTVYLSIGIRLNQDVEILLFYLHFQEPKL